MHQNTALCGMRLTTDFFFNSESDTEGGFFFNSESDAEPQQIFPEQSIFSKAINFSPCNKIFPN